MATQRNDLEVNVRGKDELSPELDRIESRLIRFVGAVGAGIAALRITTAPVAAAVELERELANVQKTTNFTSSEMARLNRELLTMSTQVDVTAKDLAKIAAAAGQQGLGREGVAGVVAFTESVARMSSVLDISAEDAADNMGKVVNIFKVAQRDYERVISVFNEVSNNSTAKGSELLDVVRRIGDAAGQLNLQQTTALAATGLDFGQSPEVVGTAFAKVFATLSQKAEAFGRLLYKTTSGATEKWLSDVRTDGLDAFKKVLAALRELNPVDQQNTIIKLFGGGRIGSLLNKLVQDTTNVVLDRNFASAQQGKLGFSAIEEQATVLNTVAAQAKITLNTLVDAGVSASEQLLGPLTNYLVRLQAALKSDEFRSFLNNVGKAVGQTLDLIDRFVTGVSSLGIAWSNLLPIIQAFLGYKLAEYVLSLTSRFLGLSQGLKSISKDAKDADGALKNSAATAAASSKMFSGAWMADKLGYRQLYDEIVRVRQAKLDLRNAEADTKNKQNAYIDAESRKRNTTAAYVPLAQNAQQALRAERAAQAALLAAQKDAADAAANIVAGRAARVQAAEQQNQQRLAQIETDYQNRRAAIAATGTQTGLRALRAEKAALLAEEQARHERSLRGIQQYWDRRAAASAAGAAAAVAAEQAAYARAQGALAAANGAAGAANAARTNAADESKAARDALTASKANAAALAASAAAAAAQGGSLGTLSVIWARLTLVWRTAQTVLATLTGALTAVASAALSAFAWFGILYTLADAFGILQPLTEAFKGLAETLGFVSKEKAAAAAQSEAHTERLRQEEQAALDLTKAYYDLRRGKNADEVRKSLNDLLATATNNALPDSERQRAFQELLKQGQAVQAAMGESQRTVDGFNKKAAEDAQRAVDAQVISVQRAQAALAQYQKQLNERTGGGAREATAGEASTLRNFELSVESARAGLKKAQDQLDTFLGRQDQLKINMESVRNDASSFSSVVQSMFTPESAKLFDEYVTKFYEYNEQIRIAREEAKRLQSSKAGKDKQDQAMLDAQVQALKEQAALNAAMADSVRTAMENQIKMLLAIPGLSDKAKDSLALLKVFMDQYASSVPAVAAAIRGADPRNLTGLGAPKAAPAASGDKKFDPKITGQESLARRLRRAELELMKANNAATANVEQEGYKQLQSISEDAFQHGLVSIQDYYAERRRIQLENIESEIRQRRADAEANRFEAAKPGLDAAEIKKYEADRARIAGDIAVLILRKQGVETETTIGIRNASKAFTQTLLQERARLSEEGLLPATIEQSFNRTLESLRANAKDQLAKLRSEGQTEVAKAVEDGLSVTAAKAAVDLVQSRLSVKLKDIEQARADIQAAVKEGRIGELEAEQQMARVISATSPSMTGMVNDIQSFLDGITDMNIRATPAFQALQQQVTGLRQNIRDLNQEIGQTARQINEDLSKELSDILLHMKGSVEGIKDAFESFMKAIGNQMLQLAAKQTASAIMEGIGGPGGTGGVGGFITGLFGGNKADGSKNNPYYTLPGNPTVENAVKEGAKLTGFSLEGLGQRIGDFFKNSDNAFVQSIASLFSVLSSGFSAMISAIFTTSAADQAASSVNGSAGGLAGLFGFAHTGGIIGSSSLVHKPVSPAVFEAARRYHSGGVIGLKPNEVPIVGLKGEEVLTKSDPRHRDNLDSSSAPGGGMVNVWIVSPDQQPQMGPNDIVAVVSDNIVRGGPIKKLIQQVKLG